MRSLIIDDHRSVLMHLVVDVGRNRLREAFQDLIVAASIAYHDCRDGKQHLMRSESRTRKLLMYKKAVDSPVAGLERMYKHKPERSCCRRTHRIHFRVA